MKQISINEVSAEIVANTLEYYNLAILEAQKETDPLKDNDYLIKAIKEVIEALRG